jgi:transcriptional regulator with XRE-family HTH domain
MEWGASRILALRKHASMTQAQFAQWLGVTIKQVKYLEHQRRNPSGPARRLLSILALQLGFADGAVQVLGASPKQLKWPVGVPKPTVATTKSMDAIKSHENEDGAETLVTDGDASVPMSDGNAFVWL